MRPAERSAQWIYYLAASCMIGAVFLRTLLVYQNTAELATVEGILLAWLALWGSEPLIARRWPAYFPIYLVIQTAAVFVLLTMPGVGDFFAALLSVLSMQVMARLNPRIGALWIALCTGLMALTFARSSGGDALALTLIYTAANTLFGFHALATRRAQAANQQNLALVQELRHGNQELLAYATKLEGLAVARERNRLARDLHDSVTQTAFSMNLTSQSAVLLLGRDPAQVNEQLERLIELARSALAEMQLLIAELRPEKVAKGGLLAAIGQLLADGRIPASLSVALEVEGEGVLTPAEEQGLFGITQEALNNSVKHAQASQAEIRLHLVEPYWLEITDRGRGFDRQEPHDGGKVGLISMAERAAEIGWALDIASAPGMGTCVRVEKRPAQEEQR